jgi:hypothetical protein
MSADPEDLSAANQEILEDEQNDVSPDIEDSCSIDSDNWNEANINGLSFPDYDKISQAVETLKNIIYMSLFQIGDKKEVHDPGVNRKYMDYIGKVGNQVLDNLSNNTPLTVIQIDKPEIEQSVEAFFTVLNDTFSKLKTPLEKSLCHDFLKLHLKCFPYCQRSECLSID